VGREAAIRGADGRLDSGARRRAVSGRHDDVVHLHRSAGTGGADDGAVRDGALAQQLRLDVLGVHVEAAREHDEVAQPAAQPQESVGVDVSDVLGAVPAVRRERLTGGLVVVPVPGGACCTSLTLFRRYFWDSFL
jgi:hypothetical protein